MSRPANAQEIQSAVDKAMVAFAERVGLKIGAAAADAVADAVKMRALPFTSDADRQDDATGGIDE